MTLTPSREPLDPEYHEHVAGDKHAHAYNGPHSHGGVSALTSREPLDPPSREPLEIPSEAFYSAACLALAYMTDPEGLAVARDRWRALLHEEIAKVAAFIPGTHKYEATSHPDFDEADDDLREALAAADKWLDAVFRHDQKAAWQAGNAMQIALMKHRATPERTTP